jgi:hypothetical protein
MQPPEADFSARFTVYELATLDRHPYQLTP